MAATVQLIEKNGAGGTPTDKTSGTIRFKNADNATVDTGNPMVKPPSGTDYSFEKWLRMNVTGGTYTEITNVKAYSDGGNGLGTGVGLYAKAVASYATPAEATSTSGYADFFGYTSGSPLSLGAGPYSSTGEKGDHCVMVMTVADTASGGVTPSETLTLAWDEI
jgi:hypothetical protein